jgi:hypothetical protein
LLIFIFSLFATLPTSPGGIPSDFAIAKALEQLMRLSFDAF